MDRIFVNKKIKQLEQIQIFRTDTFYKETLENIVDLNRKRPFKIAVAGEFSTGKSTFINAILGIDLLCHATEEVTAAITNIHNVPVSDKRYRTCDVTFMNGDTLHLEDDTKLLQYTTAQSEISDVAHEIRCVDYYASYMSDDTDIVIVDTPGLNGMADRHRELTLEEVKSADFCIYLFGVRGIADSDRVVMEQLEYYQKNFIFILNFIDQIIESDGETVEERIAELSDDLKEVVKAEYQVFGVSSLKALAYRDRSVKRLYQDDRKDIGEEERERYYAESRFGLFEKYVHEQVNSSTVEQLSVERMAYLVQNLLDDVLSEMYEMQERTWRLRQEAHTSRGIQDLEARMKYFAEVADRSKRKVMDHAKSECIRVRKEFLDYVKGQLLAMTEKYRDSLMGFKKYEELESYIKSGELDDRIRWDADKIYDYTERNMACCFNGILNNILVRIQEYLKDIHINKNEQEIEFEVRKISSRTEGEIISIEAGLRKAQDNISEAKARFERAERDIQKAEQDYRSSEEKLRANARSLDEKEREQKKRLDRLGARPEVRERTEYRTEYVTVYTYRGGLGILDKLFGPKEVSETRRVPYTIVDDSARKSWIKERDRIRAATQGEIDRYRRAVDADRTRMTNIQRQMRKKRGDVDLAKEDLNYYEQKLDQDRAMLENLKGKVNQELLDSLRNSVLRQLEEHCSFDGGTIAATVKGYIEEVMEKNSRIIYSKTEQFYDERVKKVIESYEREVEGKKSDSILKYSDHKEDMDKIVKIRKELADAE